MNKPLLAVNLEDIPVDGLDLALELSAADLLRLLSDVGPESPEIQSNLTGRLKVEKLDGRLKLRGSFKVEVALSCDRCLAKNSTVLAGEVDEFLSLAGPGYGASNNEEAESDGSLAVAGSQVDLSGLMAELFWLAWPFRFICRDDCAGLCAGCGADLNQGPCNCRQPEWN